MSLKILSVTESTVEYIRKKIISGEFKPGQRLNEMVISNSISVSRPPLREALRILEHEQLVINIPRKGTYVTKISKKDLENVYQTREMIECFAVDLLKTKNMRDLPEMERAITNIAQADQTQKVAYLEAFNQFHVKLVESTGNPLLIHFQQAISSNLARYQFIFLPGIVQYSREDHQEIYCLLKNGEYDKAKDLLRIHIRKFVDLGVVKWGEQTLDFNPGDSHTT